jgi:hypothetical protein
LKQRRTSLDLEEMEEARKRFENLMVSDSQPSMYTTSTATATRDETQLPPPPPLTHTGRKRRELEIALLRSLEHSDDGIEKLMDLWVHECPCERRSVRIMKRMDEFSSSDGSSNIDSEEAESTLRKIIADCPYWTEPAGRLALLMFSQGRLTECQYCIDQVLSLKPWHFEVLQLQLLVHLVRKDYVSAIRTARWGLPPIQQPKKRKVWITAAVARAQYQLHQSVQQQEVRGDGALLFSSSSSSSPQPSSTSAWQ